MKPVINFRHFLASVILCITAMLPAMAAQGASPVTGCAEAYKAWQSVKMPVNVKLVSPSSMGLSGTLTMVRNSQVHISFKVWGFEVATLFIDRDSIHAQEKMHKRYVSESLSDLLKGFPATVGNLQDLMMAHLFAPGSDTLSPTDFVPLNDMGSSGLIALTPAQPLPGLECCFVVNGDDHSLLGIFAGTAKREITVTYDDVAATTAAGPVAGTSLITLVADGKTKAAAELSLNVGKAQWNNASAPQWKTPRGYTRITAAQLLKSLSSL